MTAVNTVFPLDQYPRRCKPHFCCSHHKF